MKKHFNNCLKWFLVHVTISEVYIRTVDQRYDIIYISKKLRTKIRLFISGKKIAQIAIILG